MTLATEGASGVGGRSSGGGGGADERPTMKHRAKARAVVEGLGSFACYLTGVLRGWKRSAGTSRKKAHSTSRKVTLPTFALSLTDNFKVPFSLHKYNMLLVPTLNLFKIEPNMSEST